MTEEERFEEILGELGELLLDLGDLSSCVLLIWLKALRGGQMDIDLFAPTGVEAGALPTPMTPLPDARLALRQKQPVTLTLGGKTLRILLPDAAGFLAMKERAKREQRPEKAKDSFDMFAYVKLVGPEAVRASLQQAGEEGRALRGRLLDLFWNAAAPGVRDVITYAASLDTDEKELLAQAAVDLFAEL